MRRLLATLLLIVALAPGTWLRSPKPPPVDDLRLRFVPVELPPEVVRRDLLGAFALEGAWEMTSPHRHFGGFSALVPLDRGQLLAISDRGYFLCFAPPGGAAASEPRLRTVLPDPEWQSWSRDAESAAIEWAGGWIWIGWESTNRITRHALRTGRWTEVRPPAMRSWGHNSGAEAMARLDDGRFVVLREAKMGWTEAYRHAALLFPDDPVSGAEPVHFTLLAPRGFKPTDMAPLPDGRVLILMRKLVWPVPARFTGRIAVADPAMIRADEPWPARIVARLERPLPLDNFEGLAIVPREDGRVTVWLLSDDNGSAFQRTLLWKLVVDPAALPGHSSAARDPAARPALKSE